MVLEGPDSCSLSSLALLALLGGLLEALLEGLEGGLDISAAFTGSLLPVLFFFLLFPPVSSPPLFAALAARAVGLGGMLLDGAQGSTVIDEETS